MQLEVNSLLQFHFLSLTTINTFRLFTYSESYLEYIGKDGGFILLPPFSPLEREVVMLCFS